MVLGNSKPKIFRLEVLPMGLVYSTIDMFRDSSLWQICRIVVKKVEKTIQGFLDGICLELLSTIQLKQEYGNWTTGLC